VVSSARAVASAANLAESGTLPPAVAGLGAVLASLTSASINLPVVARIARDGALTRRLTWTILGVVLLGLLGLAGQWLLTSWIGHRLALGAP
jgi:uncharacterized membrane protein (DUF4010 family)